MPTEPYALCPMPHALCPVVPHLSEKGYKLSCFFLVPCSFLLLQTCKLSIARHCQITELNHIH
ncbi:MAG: hypothetical protein WBL95_08970 [Microcoleus sp.]